MCCSLPTCASSFPARERLTCASGLIQREIPAWTITAPMRRTSRSPANSRAELTGCCPINASTSSTAACVKWWITSRSLAVAQRFPSLLWPVLGLRQPTPQRQDGPSAALPLRPADTAFPIAESEGLAAPPAPRSTPVVPPGETHAQVTVPLTYNGENPCSSAALHPLLPPRQLPPPRQPPALKQRRRRSPLHPRPQPTSKAASSIASAISFPKSSANRGRGGQAAVPPRQELQSTIEAIPWFLLVLVALANSMRVSLMKTAHATTTSVTKQESGFTPIPAIDEGVFLLWRFPPHRCVRA